MGHRECDARIAELVALVESLRRTVEEQAARIRELERRLGQDSSNSDKPPSTDPPNRPRRPKQKRERGKRKPGGQPGHEGRAREFLPSDQVDDIQDHRPLACRSCRRKLRGNDPSPLRHQVTEIAPVTPTVVEHRLHCLGCPCGEWTRAPLPGGVPRGAFGPRLQAFVGLLTGAYRISKRNAAQLLSDGFGVQLAVGSIKRLEDDLSDVLAAPVEEARQYIRLQSAVGMDETGWKQGLRKAWLWTAATALVVVFAIRFSRGSKVAKELVGASYKGRVVSDRWSGYSWVAPKRRQVCWSHLKRDFEKLVEAGGELARIGEALQTRRKQLFAWWHRVRDGTLARSTFQTYVKPLRAQVADLLRQGAACTEDPRLAGMCEEILKLEVAMWTFVRVESVEPTNNHCERELRHAVIWRKTSFGTQSDAGTTFVERVLTVIGTLRLQERNVLEYLAGACTAALDGKPVPSLLPSAPLASSAAA